MENTYEHTVSASAIAQNAAFIKAIKETENIRDKPLQVTQRMSGSITFEGHRNISFSRMKWIFSKHGKRFKINFQENNTKGVRIECYEIVEHSLPQTITLPSTTNGKEISDAFASYFDAVITESRQSGSVVRTEFSLDSVTSEALSGVYSLPIVLDILIFPDKLCVDIILPSDNKGGLSYLKMNNPGVFQCRETPLTKSRLSKNSIICGKLKRRMAANRKETTSSSRFLKQWL